MIFSHKNGQHQHKQNPATMNETSPLLQNSNIFPHKRKNGYGWSKENFL